MIPLHARGLLFAMEAEEPEAFAAAEHLVDELPLRSRCGLAVHLRGENLRAQQIAVVELVPVTAMAPFPLGTIQAKAAAMSRPMVSSVFLPLVDS